MHCLEDSHVEEEIAREKHFLDQWNTTLLPSYFHLGLLFICIKTST